MRKALLTLLVLATGLQICLAQNCDQFINAANGKKFVYDNVDGKGKSAGQLTFSTTKKDASTVIYHSEMADKNGKIISSGDSEVSCDGSAINVDMRAFMPPHPGKQASNLQARVIGKSLIYPLNVSPGQSLPDGTAHIELSSDGHALSEQDINITNRKVDKQEIITTPAGSFDCMVISYDIAVKIKVVIGININMHVTEWFSTKYGRFIKSETYKAGKLMGTMQLVSVN